MRRQVHRLKLKLQAVAPRKRRIAGAQFILDGGAMTTQASSGGKRLGSDYGDVSDPTVAGTTVAAVAGSLESAGCRLVERGESHHVERIPVVDVTRIVQLGLLGFSLLFSMAMMAKFARRKEESS
jgi:hypothetical protein